MPDWRALVRERLAPAKLPPGHEADVVTELAQHLEDRYRHLTAAGLDAADAARLALQELDGHERFVRELTRAPVSLPPAPVDGPSRASWLSGTWQDARYAVRTLRRAPAFAVAAVLTVAFSTGPTLAALAVANWLFLRPVPGVSAPDRLGMVWFGAWSEGGFSPSFVSYPHVADMRAGLTAVAAIAGQQRGSINLSLDGAAPRVVPAQFVMGNFFDVLGVRMREGREFQTDEDRDPGGAPVVVLGHELARALFPGAEAVGAAVRVNDQRFTVVGVAPSGFQGTVTGQAASIWLTGLTSRRVNHLPPDRWAYEPGRGPFYEFIIRLAPGATFAEADAQLRSAARRLGELNVPETERYKTIQPTLFPGAGLEPFARGSMWSLTRILLGVGVLLVVLGVANLANLFIFRGVRRAQEAAVRRALGASAGRLARLHLVESLVVSVTGAAAGVGLAAAVKLWLDGLVVPGLGRLELALDWRLLAMAVAVAIVVGALLAIAPARMARRGSLTGAIGLSGRTGAPPGARLRTGLAIAQLVMSLTLLVGGLLFIQTLRNLHAVDLGFDPRGVSMFTFASRGQGYSPDRTVSFYRDLLQRLRAVPGLEAVSAASIQPGAGAGSGMRVLPPGAVPAPGATVSERALFQASVRVLTNDVTPGYFQALGMRLLAGRTFTEAEAYTSGAEPGVVVSASLAERLHGTAHAVGRSVTFPAQGSLPRHEAPIVGVVNNVRWRGPDAPIEDVVYRPFGDAASLSQILILRSSRPAAETARLVQAEVARLDPNLPISSDRTMTATLDQRLAQKRILAWVLGVLAALGFLLAAVGTYGLVSQAVVERTREFGIRLAIGADRRQIVRLVFNQVLVIVGVGVPLGLLLAGLGSQVIEQQLFGVTPLAPGIYALAAAGLAAAVLVAVIAPARRAVRVNPVDVLRVD